MRHVLGLVVGGVQIIYSALQAGLHDVEVLIRKGHVDNHVGFVAVEQCHNFLNAVSVDAVGRNVGFAYFLCQGLALGECAGSEDYLAENFGMLGAFTGNYCAYASDTDDNDFCHFQFCLSVILCFLYVV